jgi:hypothetical protein
MQEGNKLLLRGEDSITVLLCMPACKHLPMILGKLYYLAEAEADWLVHSWAKPRHGAAKSTCTAAKWTWL